LQEEKLSEAHLPGTGGWVSRLSNGLVSVRYRQSVGDYLGLSIRRPEQKEALKRRGLIRSNQLRYDALRVLASACGSLFLTVLTRVNIQVNLSEGRLTEELRRRFRGTKLLPTTIPFRLAISQESLPKLGGESKASQQRDMRAPPSLEQRRKSIRLAPVVRSRGSRSNHSETA
jgi:hypothetical protein